VAAGGATRGSLRPPALCPAPPPHPPSPLPTLSNTPQLAFSSVSIALKAYTQDMAAGTASYRHGVIRKAPGSAPNDPASFELTDEFTMQLAPGGAAA
jgi:hypothetical protein